MRFLLNDLNLKIEPFKIKHILVLISSIQKYNFREMVEKLKDIQNDLIKFMFEEVIIQIKHRKT